MLKLRNTFPNLKLAIVHVTTTLETALRRANRRAAETGREVPPRAIKQVLEAIPESLRRLQPHVHYVCTFRNEDMPELVFASPGEASLSAFRDVWAMSCQDTDTDEGRREQANTDVCPDNLVAWRENNYYRLFLPGGHCKPNSSL
jgi:hypothetical protein